MQRVLFLMRHAQAAPAGRGDADFDRALTAHGEAEAQATARWLFTRSPPPDYALVSAARRTHQTFDLVTGVGAVPKHATTRALYDAELATCLALVQALPPDRSAALVIAHNPGMQELLNVLVNGDVRDAPAMMGTACCAMLAAPLSWEAWGPGVAQLLDVCAA